MRAREGGTVHTVWIPYGNTSRDVIPNRGTLQNVLADGRALIGPGGGDRPGGGWQGSTSRSICHPR